MVLIDCSAFVEAVTNQSSVFLLNRRHPQIMEEEHAAGQLGQLAATFGLDVKEELSCEACSKATHQTQYVQYFHNAQVGRAGARVRWLDVLGACHTCSAVQAAACLYQPRTNPSALQPSIAHPLPHPIPRRPPCCRCWRRTSRARPWAACCARRTLSCSRAATRCGVLLKCDAPCSAGCTIAASTCEESRSALYCVCMHVHAA